MGGMGYSFGHNYPYVGGNGASGGNGGSGAGGALYQSAGTLLALNLTVATNGTEGGAGGRPGAGGSGIDGNGSPGGAGSVGGSSGFSAANIGGVVTLKNSLFCPGVNSANNIYGTVVDAGNNIDSVIESWLTNGTSISGVNPELAPLGNYGGPTPTMALLAGSPAIHAADPTYFPVTDQRGVPRPYGSAPDIGAFEYATYVTISGYVKGLMSNDEVTVIAGSISTLTTNNGAYSILDDRASRNISPSNANYVFVPPTQTVSLTSNQTGVNFQAYRVNTIYLGSPAANSLNFMFAGTNSQQFTVETSTNCMTWAPIVTNIIGTAGYTNVSFPMSNSGSLFFRLVSP